jgi:TIR domain
MIFISHKETDNVLAEALVEFLRSSLVVADRNIRCSSVPGFQLPLGKTVSGQLKEDVGASDVLFALITPASINAPWVLFEIGAAWALNRRIIPILSPGIRPRDLPGPLSEYVVIDGSQGSAAARLRDAVNQIALQLGLTEKGGGLAQSSLESFLSLLRGSARTAANSVPPDGRRQPLDNKCVLAFELSWAMCVFLEKRARNPIIEGRIEAYADQLGLRLPPGWATVNVANDGGLAFNDLVGNVGGQLQARFPKSVPYFEAGVNLPLAASRGDEVALRFAISRIDLPEELREVGRDRVDWANHVQSHFESLMG